MKKIYNIFAVILTIMVVVGCSSDDGNDQSRAMTINAIYLEDASSGTSIHDRLISVDSINFVRLGQTIRIQGTGFSGLKKILINGYDTYFNNALVTDNNVWVTLNSKTPVADADPSVRNSIVLVKDNTKTTYSFVIRAASPSISHFSNTLPAVGEKVTVYGSNLQEITEIILPGDVLVNTDITSYDDGDMFDFIMPDGVNEGGSVFITGANGNARSASQFNCKAGLIINFDGTGSQGY